MDDIRWCVKLVCCGRDDGEYLAATWEEADAFRESYTGADSRPYVIDPHGYSGHDTGHKRAGIIVRMEGAMTRFLEPDDPGAIDIDVSLFCSECGGELTDEEITVNNQDNVAEDERLCQNCMFDLS